MGTNLLAAAADMGVKLTQEEGIALLVALAVRALTIWPRADNYKQAYPLVVMVLSISLAWVSQFANPLNSGIQIAAYAILTYNLAAMPGKIRDARDEARAANESPKDPTLLPPAGTVQ